MQEGTTPSPAPQDLWFLPSLAKQYPHPGIFGACLLFSKRSAQKRLVLNYPFVPCFEEKSLTADALRP